MILHSIRLRNLLRFRGEVSLNCRDLPGGLIALKGPNGGGKTCFMEAPIGTLYRTFPSRAKKEPFDYATQKDAFLETVFELEGRGLYRARVNLDPVSRKADPVLFHISADGTETPLSDGKAASYDARIAELLPSLNALLVSVYASQDRHGSFARLEKKDRRTLFGSLCGCDHYEAMAERARLASARVSDAIAEAARDRVGLVREAGPDVENDLERRAQQLQVAAGDVDVRRATLTVALAEAEAALATVQAQATAHAAAQAAHNRLMAELQARHRERHRIIDSFTRADAAIADEERDVETRLQHTLNEAETRIVDTRTDLAHAESIRAAIAKVAEIDAQLAAAVDRQTAIQAQLDALRKQERAGLQRRTHIEQAERDRARVARDADILTTVPCQGADRFKGCDFLKNAIAAKAQLPPLDEVLAERPTVDHVLATTHASLEAVDRERAALRERVAELSATKARYLPLAQRAPALAAATERIAALEQQQRDARATAERARETLQERARVQAEQFAEQGRDIRLTIDALTHELTTADQVLTDTAAAAALADEHAATVRHHRRAWDETTAQRATVQAQIANLQAQRTQLAARRRELEALDVRLAFLRNERVEWDLYAKVLGREGLPTLEIDAAGPTVAALCNQLLEACYGGRFTVDLRTQVAKRKAGKNGTTEKETFELIIFDALDAGAARDLTDLSGGEQVVVEEAFRSAIALMVNLRNEQPIRTCWRDESMGALYADAVPHFMAVLRKVLEIGRFHQLFYVTHNTDAQLYADAQVAFDGRGALRAEFPPYAALEGAA
jgi:exonuclease SbcC